MCYFYLIICFYIQSLLDSLQWSLGKRWCTSWTGRQSVTGQHKNKETNNHSCSQLHLVTVQRYQFNLLVHACIWFLEGNCSVKRKPSHIWECSNSIHKSPAKLLNHWYMMLLYLFILLYICFFINFCYFVVALSLIFVINYIVKYSWILSHCSHCARNIRLWNELLV